MPRWRARDVRREIDLVEEVARFRLEDVPPTLPERTAMFGRLSHEQRLRRAGLRSPRRLRVRRGVHVLAAAVRPRPGALALPVPLSEQQRVLRTTLLPGLVRAARHNVASATPDVALFEVAHVYLPTDGPLPREPWRLGGVLRGGFFRPRACRGVFALLQEEPRFEAATHPFHGLARLRVGAGRLGGAARPASARGRVAAFELDLADLFAQVPERILYET